MELKHYIDKLRIKHKRLLDEAQRIQNAVYEIQEYCDHDFPEEPTLETHGEKMYRCHICGKEVFENK